MKTFVAYISWNGSVEPGRIRRIMNKIVGPVWLNVFLGEICKRRACAILFSCSLFSVNQLVDTEWRDKSERMAKAKEKGNVHQGELCLQQQQFQSKGDDDDNDDVFCDNNPQEQQQQPQTSKWSMAHFLNAIDLVTCAMMTFRSYCLLTLHKQTRRLDVSQKDKKKTGAVVHLYG